MLAFVRSMDDSHQASAEKVRSLIERGLHDRGMFRAALLTVPPEIRDGWLDIVFGLGDLPNDGPELPRGCVPYVPSSVDALLRVVEQAPVRASDVFVDVGSGLGRAAALVHLLTGAAVIGLEIQPHLVIGARDLAARLLLSRISSVEGDAAKLAGYIPIGSVFFLYCPFGGERLARVLGGLKHIARTRELRICCIDLPLPPCSWLTLDPPLASDLAIYRSILFDGTFGRRTVGGTTRDRHMLTG
jgi:SAM-dependent methyltransferase